MVIFFLLETSIVTMGFPGSSVGKESACNAGDLGSIPGLGRSPGERREFPKEMNKVFQGNLEFELNFFLY